MIIYKRNGRKVTAEFDEPWIFSISNYFAKRGISERKFIEKYLNRRTKFDGVAKCMEGDKYDWNYGKNLAKQRLLSNYFNTIQELSYLLEDMLEARRKQQLKELYKTANKFKELERGNIGNNIQ